VALLGDNIFFGSNMDELLQSNKTLKEELFCLPRFGPGTIWVVEFERFKCIVNRRRKKPTRRANPILLYDNSVVKYQEYQAKC
jgi:hypothetical protein